MSRFGQNVTCQCLGKVWPNHPCFAVCSIHFAARVAWCSQHHSFNIEDTLWKGEVDLPCRNKPASLRLGNPKEPRTSKKNVMPASSAENLRWTNHQPFSIPHCPRKLNPNGPNVRKLCKRFCEKWASNSFHESCRESSRKLCKMRKGWCVAKGVATVDTENAPRKLPSHTAAGLPKLWRKTSGVYRIRWPVLNTARMKVANLVQWARATYKDQNKQSPGEKDGCKMRKHCTLRLHDYFVVCFPCTCGGWHSAQ